jgi:hypothetical protein
MDKCPFIHPFIHSSIYLQSLTLEYDQTRGDLGDGEHWMHANVFPIYSCLTFTLPATRGDN